MDYRVLTEAERKYTFSQSQQLSMQTGLIGYLRADFGSNGNEFWTTWNDFRKDLKTDEFKAEFDDVINGLRDGDVLSGRKAMSSYCYSTPDSSFNDDRNHYGIRLDRTHLRKQLRRNLSDNELSNVKEQITAITSKLWTLRKEVGLCDDIAERSKVIEANLETVRVYEEKQERKEQNRNDKRRGCGRTGRQAIA